MGGWEGGGSEERVRGEGSTCCYSDQWSYNLVSCTCVAMGDSFVPGRGGEGGEGRGADSERSG